MKVKDVMTKDVSYIKPDASIIEAAQLMQKLNVGSIPVCDQNGVVGMVTDRDIVVRNVAFGTDPQNTPVSNIMTTKITTTSPDADMNDISHMMARNQIRRVPVVEGKNLVGIVAIGDMAADQRFDAEASEALTEISKPAKPQK